MNDSDHILDATARRLALKEGYAVIFTNASKDTHNHNATFADEISPGLLSYGVSVRCLDYINDVRQVSEALRDPHCLFFLCFNGFGSELKISYAPGNLGSAFEYYQKPLFDLMHDCPIHEAMAHQIGSTGQYRKLLMTDYSYAHLARLLGVKNVHAVSSITFPRTIGQASLPLSARPIDVLLPVGLSSFQRARERYAAPRDYKERIFRQIFEGVTEYAVANLEVDPLIQTLLAFQELQMPVNLQDAHVRFLFTSIVDYVKFARRDHLVRSIQHLPITVVAERDVREVYKDTNFRFLGMKSFPELVRTMGEAKSVICPLPHHTGFHERALSAFSAESVVIAAPNDILETNFVVGRDMISYRSVEQLATLLESVVAGRIELQSIASNGKRKALDRFPPERIADIIVSLWSTVSRH